MLNEKQMKKFGLNIPEGYEFERIGFPKVGDYVMTEDAGVEQLKFTGRCSMVVILKPVVQWRDVEGHDFIDNTEAQFSDTEDFSTCQTGLLCGYSIRRSGAPHYYLADLEPFTGVKNDEAYFMYCRIRVQDSQGEG